MPDVAVITDSTACLPSELARQWGITVVQLQLTVGDRTDDEARFDRQELTAAMRAGESVTTAPPDPGAFFWAYQDAVSSGATAIVSLHISGRMSATVDHARQAAEQIRVPVHVLDSQTLSMSLGFAALSAARAAQAGAQARRVIDTAERRCQRSAELLYVDTLEYLRRGGRIGRATALLGTALGVKPLLTVAAGEVSPLGNALGARRALARLTDTAVRRATGYPVDVAILGLAVDERMQAIADELRERLPMARDIVLLEASAVVGAHTGPDTIGITVSPTG